LLRPAPAPAMEAQKPSFTLALCAGGCAGTSVDVVLFPIDTIRTRMQSVEGFRAAGGFRGIYQGLSAATIGSAPGAAMFFATYETAKPMVGSVLGKDTALSHSSSAAVGEVAACLTRVPTNVVTQRMQVGQYKSLQEAVQGVLASGGLRAFYSGFGTTVMREIPFAFVQFPIYERLKITWRDSQQAPTEPWQGALCGAVAGGIAGAVTTPLDVAKTRLMLGTARAGAEPYKGTANTLMRISREEGAGALFKGIGPRVQFITMGGLIFFGAYEAASDLLRAVGWS